MISYLPQLRKIKKIRSLTSVIKLFTIEGGLRFNPGQIVEASVFGFGEAPFAPTSSPFEKDFFELCIRKTGTVTNAFHDLKVGDSIGIRGPFGNGFDLEKWRKKSLVLVGGGLGLVPLRPLIKFIEEKREDFGQVSIFYGAKSPDEIIFKKDLREWEKRFDLSCTVDKAAKGWWGEEGLVTDCMSKKGFLNKNAVAVLCGPPVMFKFVIELLKKQGFKDKDIYVSLERKMQCGVGICQHCAIGSKYVCTDGPVFRLDQVERF